MDEYLKGYRVPDLFIDETVGVVTARDKLTVHLSPDDVWDTVTRFASLGSEEARHKFNLGNDARDWLEARRWLPSTLHPDEDSVDEWVNKDMDSYLKFKINLFDDEGNLKVMRESEWSDDYIDILPLNQTEPDIEFVDPFAS